LVVFAVAWPYFLGTYIAVAMGADNPSTARTAIGWVFEAAYLLAFVVYFALTRERRAQEAAESVRRHRELVASGVVYQARHGQSLVYRHGTCTVNHRSHETAARCRNG
jgi:hypothetical protein